MDGHFFSIELKTGDLLALWKALGLKLITYRPFRRVWKCFGSQSINFFFFHKCVLHIRGNHGPRQMILDKGRYVPDFNLHPLRSYDGHTHNWHVKP